MGSKLTGENCIPKMGLTEKPLTEAQEVQKKQDQDQAEQSKKDALERDCLKWFMGLSNAKLAELLAKRKERFGKGEAVQPEA